MSEIKLKTSQKLNKLYNELLEINQDHNCEDLLDKLEKEAFYINDFSDGVIDTMKNHIKMFEVALKNNKSIYYLKDEAEWDDTTLYFVDDVSNIEKLLVSFLDKAKKIQAGDLKEEKINEDDCLLMQINQVEARLKNLKLQAKKIK